MDGTKKIQHSDKAMGCFFCGEPDGSLINNPTAYYRPCVSCAALKNMGVSLIGFTRERHRDGRPPIAESKTDSLYPTGQWIVLTKEALPMVFPKQAMENMGGKNYMLLGDPALTELKKLLGLNGRTLADTEDIKRAMERVSMEKSKEREGKGKNGN